MTAENSSLFTVPTALSLDELAPGTNVMVNGPSGNGARRVALQLMMAGHATNDGVLLLSADVSGRALLERATSVAGEFDRGQVGVVDCSGVADDQQRFDEHGETIEDPGDLMGIEMEFSVLYETLAERGHDRIRLGVFSVSSLLAHADLRDVSRFVHMLTGRVIATRDLGVFLVDGTMEADTTVDAIEQYCDATIDVRDGETSEFEARIRGITTDSAGWTSVTPSE